MRILDWYVVALASLAAEIVLSAKVPDITSCPLNHYAVLNEDGSGISACLVCDSCPPGYGVERPCSPTENTVCGLCPMGTFSTTISHEDRCSPCKTCSDVGVMKECSPISDAVCMEQCPFGEYYDPATSTCEQCSYCFPDRPYARTARVLDCQRQGLHIDYQCSPLSRTDAVDVVHPGVITADRHRSETAARRHPGRTVHTSISATENVLLDERRRGRILGPPRHGARMNNGESSGNILPSVISLFRTTEGPPLFEDKTPVSDQSLNHLRTDTTANSDERGEQELRVTGMREPYIEESEQDFDSQSKPKTGKQETIIPYYHSMTSTDIVLLIVIVIILMLISIVITGISCYCWMKRGKSMRGSKVNSINSKLPSNAWTYQDMMPPATELRPLVRDTPPQSRRLMTCV